MKKYMLNSLFVAIIMTLAASCQPAQKESEKDPIALKDTIVSPNIKVESGYADVNGLKMYYEVHQPTTDIKSTPIVLIHGSFMTIPLNWSATIPLLAKDRKVIVAEMQGHGRTKDTSRKFSYEGMADDVSALLKHLKIDSADILGYCMGGGVAFQVAARWPRN